MQHLHVLGLFLCLGNIYIYIYIKYIYIYIADQTNHEDSKSRENT